MKFNVIGYPIGHSMSPFIHKELFSLKSINADYGKLEIAPNELCARLEKELKLLDGFNVTIPHKISIISLIDKIDPIAAEYGAVNTVLRKNGKLYGYNTDAYGFLEGLRFSKISLGDRVAVYGFGGAARTIITECLKANCDVTVITTEDRLERAREAAREIETKTEKALTVTDENGLFGEYDLLINASPVGMHPNVTGAPLEEKQLRMFKAVYDIVYNPVETELLKKAKKLGKICGGGLSMLVCQAQKAHEIWYGAKFSKSETEKIISKAALKLEEDFKL